MKKITKKLFRELHSQNKLVMIGKRCIAKEWLEVTLKDFPKSELNTYEVSNIDLKNTKDATVNCYQCTQGYYYVEIVADNAPNTRFFKTLAYATKESLCPVNGMRLRECDLYMEAEDYFRDNMKDLFKYAKTKEDYWSIIKNYRKAIGYHKDWPIGIETCLMLMRRTLKQNNPMTWS